ncbi:hypothetical protein KHC17_24990 (plasmid) [Agrobacterium salinitolerans]|uniref:hypothetical protein n=1 Tax=Agrobacterium salinitolerans TaxID=1183413 RepID=UPI001C2210B2|nr:hypothetical protein [Agrobacterium salinitolerans]QXC52509.1 hypothetical protein KHC17_24990 [Agrobacterium salinitolerans]
MSPIGIKNAILAAIQRELERQSESPDHPCLAQAGAPERAALTGCFDLEELTEAICAALLSERQD